MIQRVNRRMAVSPGRAIPHDAADCGYGFAIIQTGAGMSDLDVGSFGTMNPASTFAWW